MPRRPAVRDQLYFGARLRRLAHGLLDLLSSASIPSARGTGAPTIPPRIRRAASEVIAAHLQALRAGRVASLPFGRVVISPYEYERAPVTTSR